LITTLAVFGAAAITPGVSVRSFGHAAVAALLIGVLNAVITPFVAALRLPFTLGLGFVTVLLIDGLILLLASDVDSRSIKVSSFGAALVAALVISALVVVLRTILGANDDDTYQLRVIIRIARRERARVTTDVPGIVFLEIDGLALPVLERAMRDDETPNMAGWLESDGYRPAAAPVLLGGSTAMTCTSSSSARSRAGTSHTSREEMRTTPPSATPSLKPEDTKAMRAATVPASTT